MSLSQFVTVRKNNMDLTKEIITIIGAILVCGGFWTFIQFIISRKDKKKEDGEGTKKALEDLQKAITLLQESLDTNNQNMDLQSEALMAIAQDRIIFLGGEFIKQGYIPVNDRANLRRMADAYKALGGNALAKEVMDEVDKLPIKGE